MHVPGLASLLEKKLRDPSVNVAAPEALADLTKKSLPVVPFLFLFYLALPGYILYLVGAGGLGMVSYWFASEFCLADDDNARVRYCRRPRV
ncbi:hypothetical protein FOZ62_000417 [Perkinsus olseni]|nr:hypothetical protein FOZ62_000417 [Perkinsus olseni]